MREKKHTTMNFGFLEFAFAFVLFCSNVESANSYTCYNDTITLNEIIVQPFSGGTYHICAGTTINVGVADGRLGYKGGAFPVVLAHGGIKILCGENGSVENNCVFRGGDAAFEIINPGFYTRPTYKPTGVALLPGLHIEGFTFTGLKFPVFSYRDALAQVSLKVKNCKFVVSLKDNVFVECVLEKTKVIILLLCFSNLILRLLPMLLLFNTTDCVIRIIQMQWA